MVWLHLRYEGRQQMPPILAGVSAVALLGAPWRPWRILHPRCEKEGGRERSSHPAELLFRTRGTPFASAVIKQRRPVNCMVLMLVVPTSIISEGEAVRAAVQITGKGLGAKTPCFGKRCSIS